MNLQGMQWVITIVVGLLVGWILPAAMKETNIMPYGKGIASGICGALIAAIIYGLTTAVPTNGMLVLWTIIGAVALYFIIRATSKKNTPNNSTTYTSK